MPQISILSTSDSDPLTGALEGVPGISIMPIDDISKHVLIEPWPKVLESDYPHELLDSIRGTVLFNRTFSINNSDLMRRVLDSGYHHMWAHVAIDPLLRAATSITHDPGCRGVSRSLLPLPTQWARITSADPEVNIPKYIYAFGGELPDLSSFRDPMQKSVWSIFDWKEERSLPSNEAGWHRFFVERPTGTPVICCFVDPALLGSEGIFYLFPRDTVLIDKAAFTDIARAASVAFGSLIGEVLLFIAEDGEIVFHGFSPLMESGLASEEGARIISYWASL